MSSRRRLRRLRHALFDPLARAPLSPGDIAVDCGANVGNITARLAATGATVYAFEPNPAAFERLCERFRENSNVHCLPLAVGVQDSKQKLFFHERAAEDPVGWSTGSSLLSTKPNVGEDGVIVEVAAIAPFLRGFERVRVLKIDVEGTECDIINHLMDDGAANLVDVILVETHDDKFPALRGDTDRLRARIRREKRTNIHLDWE